jgi:hypothetical protein
MNEAQAKAAGLVQIWTSTGTRKQNELAHTICEDLRSKGVTAEVIQEEVDWKKSNAVWRDREYEKRERKEVDA